MSNGAPAATRETGTLFGAFDERGYHVEARMPAGTLEPQVWQLKITRDGAVVAERQVQMYHPPVFGPDIEDVDALERATEELLATLP